LAEKVTSDSARIPPKRFDIEAISRLFAMPPPDGRSTAIPKPRYFHIAIYVVLLLFMV